MYEPRRKEVVTFISYNEVNELLAKFFGLDKYNLVPDMAEHDSGWGNDTIQRFDIEPDDDGSRPAHLQWALAKKKVGFAWELDAVMNAIAAQGEGDLSPGCYIVEVCW